MPRFQLQLLAALALLVAAVAGLAWALVELGLDQEREHRTAEELIARAELVRSVVAGTPIDAADFERLDALADRMAESAHARVTLIAPDGRVAGDSEVPRDRVLALDNHGARPEVVEARGGESGRSRRFSATLRRTMLYVAVPMADGGVVRLAADEDSLASAVPSLRQELLIAAAAGLLAAVGLSALLVRWSRRAAEDIRDVLRDLAEGRLERRVHWGDRDAFPDLAAGVNRAADRLGERLAEATAEKSQLEAVLAGMVEGVLVVDRNGLIVLANPRIRELFDAWGTLQGRRPLEVIRVAAVQEALDDARTRGMPVSREFEVGGSASGFLLMHAAPLGEAGTVAVFHDVSEVRRLEQVRRDFLANASHELRTPLTSIQGFADTLMENGVDDAQRRSYLEVIVRNAGRLSSLIDDLMELSRIEGRRAPLLLAAVHVHELARGLLEDLGPRLAQKRLEAHLDVAGEAIAWGDRRAVEQVISNLLDNAVKYTDEEGRIDVAVRDAGERVEVEIRDTGIGIPEADRDRIFERFYRVDKARSRALGGTGLGLAIVKHLVQAMGGDILVESGAGKGTTFRFWLPRPPASPTTS